MSSQIKLQCVSSARSCVCLYFIGDIPGDFQAVVYEELVNTHSIRHTQLSRHPPLLFYVLHPTSTFQSYGYKINYILLCNKVFISWPGTSVSLSLFLNCFQLCPPVLEDTYFIWIPLTEQKILLSVWCNWTFCTASISSKFNYL